MHGRARDATTPRIETDDSGRIPVFTYAREGLEPVALVADFARDFARYLIATIDEPPPGGEALRDPALELPRCSWASACSSRTPRCMRPSTR